MTVPKDYSPNTPVSAVVSEENVDLSWTGMHQEGHIYSDLKVSRGICADSVSNRQDPRIAQAVPW